MFEVPCQCSWPQTGILKVCLLSGVSVRFPKAMFNWKCWYNYNLRQNIGGMGTLANERPLELELSFHHLKVKLALVKVERGYFPFYWDFSESWGPCVSTLSCFLLWLPACQHPGSILCSSGNTPRATRAPLEPGSTVLQLGMQLYFQQIHSERQRNGSTWFLYPKITLKADQSQPLDKFSCFFSFWFLQFRWL